MDYFQCNRNLLLSTSNNNDFLFAFLLIARAHLQMVIKRVRGHQFHCYLLRLPAERCQVLPIICYLVLRRGVVLDRHITIFQESLSPLPEDGDISHRLPTAIDDNVTDPIDETTGLRAASKSMVPHM
jgi:hypothetical protein